MEIFKRSRYYSRKNWSANGSLDRSSMFVFPFFGAFEIFIFINTSDKKCMYIHTEYCHKIT